MLYNVQKKDLQITKIVNNSQNVDHNEVFHVNNYGTQSENGRKPILIVQNKIQPLLLH